MQLEVLLSEIVPTVSTILVRISSSAHGIKEGEQCLAHWSPRAVNGEHVLAHQFAPLLNPAFRSIGSVPLSFRPDFLVAWLCSIVVPPGFPGGMALFQFFFLGCETRSIFVWFDCVVLIRPPIGFRLGIRSRCAVPAADRVRFSMVKTCREFPSDSFRG